MIGDAFFGLNQVHVQYFGLNIASVLLLGSDDRLNCDCSQRIAYPIPALAAFDADGPGIAACAMAVCTCPARSLMADTSFARSLVKIATVSFAREIPT